MTSTEKTVTYFNGKYTVPYKEKVLSPYDRNNMSVNTDDGEFILVWTREDGSKYATSKDVEQIELKSHKSDVYPYKGKFFVYDFTDALVSMMSKVTEEELAEEEEWKLKHNGRGLMNYTEDGYYVWETVGLMREHWSNVELRNVYLDDWLSELEYETESMVEDFIKYELPLLQRGELE